MFTAICNNNTSGWCALVVDILFEAARLNGDETLRGGETERLNHSLWAERVFTLIVSM